MNLSYLKLTLSCLLMIVILAPSAIAQCSNVRDFISAEPAAANSTQQVRIIVAKTYPDGCSGLQKAELLSVDEDNLVIEILFDQFCFDTTSCTTAEHCDSAHFVIDGLAEGVYDIRVIDNNDNNHVCDTVNHETALGSNIYLVKDIEVEGFRYYAPAGTKQCVPFRIRGFENLIDMQMSFKWDSNVAKYDTTIDLYPLEYFVPFSIFSPRANEVRVVWFDDLAEGQSIDDNVILCQFCLDLVGNDGDTALLDFDLGPIPSIAGSENPDSATSLITSNGWIIIDSDRYGVCDADTAEVLCVEWVKDSMESKMREYCVDSSNLTLDLVEWRGYEILRFTETTLLGTGDEIGVESFFGCDGEVIGECQLGGFAGGTCSNFLLQKEISLVRNIWTCGDALPTCYTTSNKDEFGNEGILVNNISSDYLTIKSQFENEFIQIIGTGGEVISSHRNGRIIDVQNLNPGIYYIRSGQITEKFVVIR